MENVRQQIRAYVLNAFPLARQKQVKNNESLIEGGFVDSLGVLDLVSYLEKEFKVDVADDELVPSNFQSIDSLAEFVISKHGALSGQVASEASGMDLS